MKSLNGLTDKELKIILGGLIIRMETGVNENEEIDKICKELIDHIEDTINNS